MNPASARTRRADSLVRFGVFEVDLDTGELKKSGVRVRLPSQPFRILCLLLEHPGEVVTREELRRRLWPEDTYVEFDRCLNSAINRLRETLRDSADHPLYIETLPKRGYRFLAPVERPAVAEEEAEPVAVAAPAAEKSWGGWRRLAVIAAAATLLIAGLWYAFRLTPGAGAGVRPLTDYAGSEITPAYSPDGSRVAYAWNGGSGNDYDIYVQAPGGKPVRLSDGPAEDFGPAFSPDGRRLVFYRRTGDRMTICTASLEPGSARRLVDDLNIGPPGPSLVLESGGQGWSLERPSWSPDGKSVVYVDRSSPNDPLSLFVLDIETREWAKLSYSASAAERDGSPVFSPDGQRLAFVRGEKGGQDIYVLVLATGELRRLTTDGRRIRGLDWTSDSKKIVFASDRAGETYLWRVPASGGVVERVPEIAEPAAYPSLPSRGRGLAFLRWSRSADLWILPLGGLPGEPASRARVEIPGLPGPFGTPRFSPDGTRLLFTFSGSGRAAIWAAGVGGENPVPVGKMDEYSGSPNWSPDGRQVAFDSVLRGNWDIFVAGAQGGGLRALTNQPGEDLRPSWSAGGRRIYFGSDRSGTMQIWSMAADGSGGARQLTTGGGFEALESPDGRFVYYTRRGHDGLWRVPSAGGEEIPVAKEPTWENSRNWVVAAAGVYFLHLEVSGAARNYLLKLLAPAGRVQTVASLGPSRIPDNGISVSADGKRLLYVQRDDRETDIALAPEFR